MKENKLFLILCSHKLGSMRADNSADGVLHSAYISHCSCICWLISQWRSIYSVYIFIFIIYTAMGRHIPQIRIIVLNTAVTPHHLYGVYTLFLSGALSGVVGHTEAARANKEFSTIRHLFFQSYTCKNFTTNQRFFDLDKWHKRLESDLKYYSFLVNAL